MPDQKANRFIRALNALRGKSDPRDGIIRELHRDLAGTSNVLKQMIGENARLKETLSVRYGTVPAVPAMETDLNRQRDRFNPLPGVAGQYSKDFYGVEGIQRIKSGIWMQEKDIPDTRIHIGQSVNGFHSGLEVRGGTIVWTAPFPIEKEAVTDALNREVSYRNVQRALKPYLAPVPTPERSR